MYLVCYHIQYNDERNTFFQLFWTQASPEGMRTNGTHRSHARCNPTIRKGWPHHRGLRPLLFSNGDVGSFTSHKNKSVKVLWDRTYSFSSLSEKTRKSNQFADVITKAALFSQLFKYPECWCSRGLNLWPPARQTGALPTELTRRRTLQ